MSWLTGTSATIGSACPALCLLLSQGRGDRAQVRDWANRNGHQVSNRGRISAPSGRRTRRRARNKAPRQGCHVGSASLLGRSGTVTISVSSAGVEMETSHPASAGRLIAGRCGRHGTRTRRGTRGRTLYPGEQRRGGRPQRTLLLWLGEGRAPSATHSGRAAATPHRDQAGDTSTADTGTRPDLHTRNRVSDGADCTWNDPNR
jgi:hypothetical protein